MHSDLPSILAALTKSPALSNEPRGVEGFSSLHPIMRMRQWIDRRLSRRVRLNIPVKVHAYGQSYRATITDASPNGVGLSDVDGLANGDAVVISIGDYITLRGDVRWCQNGNAGVRLATTH